MKATVQYNDYVGSTAADISDFTTLEKYLEEIDVDIKRYHPIGVKFFTSYGDGCNVSILCEDMVNDNSLVELRLDEMSIPDFFSLFKKRTGFTPLEYRSFGRETGIVDEE